MAGNATMQRAARGGRCRWLFLTGMLDVPLFQIDRKSTRLNSSHANISYAVFCLKKTDLVHRRLRVGDLEVHDGIDVDRQVVLGDHRLRRERDHPLTEVDPRPDLVDKLQKQCELA